MSKIQFKRRCSMIACSCCTNLHTLTGRIWVPNSFEHYFALSDWSSFSPLSLHSRKYSYWEPRVRFRDLNTQQWYNTQPFTRLKNDDIFDRVSWWAFLIHYWYFKVVAKVLKFAYVEDWPTFGTFLTGHMGIKIKSIALKLEKYLLWPAFISP